LTGEESRVKILGRGIVQKDLKKMLGFYEILATEKRGGWLNYRGNTTRVLEQKGIS